MGDYLWLIPLIIFLLVIFVRFILPYIVRDAVKKAAEKGNICDKCKGGMDTISETLCLIPVSFDHKHERTAEYYINNSTPIQSVEQIPTGNRACRIAVLKCRICDRKEVGVVDFLRVRDTEITESIDIFPYEPFSGFIERLPQISAAERSVAKDGSSVNKFSDIL